MSALSHCFRQILIRRSRFAVPIQKLQTAVNARFSAHRINVSSCVQRFDYRYFAKSAKQNKMTNNKSSDMEESTLDEKNLEEDTKRNMTGAILNFSRHVAQMRPTKADAGIFDAVHVQAYGQYVPLPQVTQVAVSGNYSVSITIYDPSLIKVVKQAIQDMNPCYSIQEEANALQVSFPKMSKETRTELVKAAKKQAEQARQHVRRVRQDAMNSVKKNKELAAEDEIKKIKDQIQDMTDQSIKQIDALYSRKESELLAI